MTASAGIDNALHGDDDPQEFPDRTVSYLGALEAALRQLAAGIEDGVEPAPKTTPGGVQPVVHLTVDGAPAATVRVGEPVSVRIEAQAPEREWSSTCWPT